MSKNETWLRIVHAVDVSRDLDVLIEVDGQTRHIVHEKGLGSIEMPRKQATASTRPETCSKATTT